MNAANEHAAKPSAQFPDRTKRIAGARTRALGESRCARARDPRGMTATQVPPVDTPYFPVARHKLIVMSVTTLSMYQIYWFYRNWQRIDARALGGSPFWRAIAAPITAHGLFSRVRADAQSRFISVGWSSIGLAVIYFVLTLVCFFDYPWWTLALASVLALLPVHATMQAVNTKAAPHSPRNDSYSRVDILAIAAGIGLTIIGLYVTREAKEFVTQLLDQL